MDNLISGILHLVKFIWSLLTDVNYVLGVPLIGWFTPVVALSICWWFLMIFIHLLAIFRGHVFYSKAKQEEEPPVLDHYPGVSILRPLKGIDTCLETNLRASFHVDYPNYEVIFSVADKDDPARYVAENLIKQYPHIDAKIIIGEEIVGVNPKVNNLVTSYRRAKNDIIWVCDSNVLMSRGVLARSVAQLQGENVGLVHHLPRGIQPGDFGAALESIYLSTSHARMYIFLNWIGPVMQRLGIVISCVIGKSSLFRKSTLDSFGGLKYFGQFLAEDNVMGRVIMEKGLRTAMTADIASQTLGNVTATQYALRRIRWGRMRFWFMPISTVLEPFTESLVCGLFASLGASLVWNIHPLNFLGFHFSLWFVLDAWLFQTLMHSSILSYHAFAMAWSFREIVYLPLCFWSCMGKSVTWRGQHYYLVWGGKVVPASVAAAADAEAKKQSSGSTLEPFHRFMDRMKEWTSKQFIKSVVTTFILAVSLLIDILARSERNGRRRTEVEEASLSAEQVKEAGLLSSFLTARWFFGDTFRKDPNEEAAEEQAEEEETHLMSRQGDIAEIVSIGDNSTRRRAILRPTTPSGLARKGEEDSCRSPTLSFTDIWKHVHTGILMHLKNEENVRAMNQKNHSE